MQDFSIPCKASRAANKVYCDFCKYFLTSVVDPHIFDADQDADADPDAYPDFYLMRMRIQVTKMIRIHNTALNI